MLKVKLKNNVVGCLCWSHYPSSGDTAIIIMDENFEERYCVPTVNLYDPAPPPCADDEIWLKTWSENEEIDKALEEAGVCFITGEVWPAGYCLAKKAKLTEKAIRERDIQMTNKEKSAQNQARTNSRLSWKTNTSKIEG